MGKWGQKVALFYFGNSIEENGLAVGVDPYYPALARITYWGMKSAFRIRTFFTRAVENGKKMPTTVRIHAPWLICYSLSAIE